jgi:hypothetical protein
LDACFFFFLEDFVATASVAEAGAVAADFGAEARWAFSVAL